jgi:hypothetical protein
MTALLHWPDTDCRRKTLHLPPAGKNRFAQEIEFELKFIIGTNIAFVMV